jgi:competence CoiA-like predicted nuclease
MLTSIRESDNLKVIGEQIPKDKNEKYRCEYCKKEVIHHRSSSKIRIGHFKHKFNESFCPNAPETIEHLITKNAIFNYIKEAWNNSLREIELEKWLCKNTIRPDIYIETKKGNKIAIEVQASVLQVSEIKRRTQKYFKENIYVLWVLLFDKKRFVEYRQDFGYDAAGEWNLLPYAWHIVQRIKLKEFEIFLYWCYFKKLIYWDISKKYSESFIVVELDDYISDGSEFYKEGEYKSFEGKKAKTFKTLNRFRHSIGFNEFELSHAKSFIPFPRN